MKSPITLLEDLQSNLNRSPLVAMQSLINFASKDLDATIRGVYDLMASYEVRLAARDEEIKELESQLPNDAYFNRLSDNLSQLEFVAEHEIKEVA